MMERIRRARRDEGFTLIEVLVVISILGVLAGIVVFAVAGITDRGKTSACSTDKATVQTAIQAYYAVNSQYPANTAAMVPGFLAQASTAYSNSGATITAIAGNTNGCS
ncbi:MAG: prepilin-type N-terminal cleavage/methylation domain-containing protein [Mycobacteriales bacterium]